MVGYTAEAWPLCSSRSDSEMLRVWFSCIPFAPTERSVDTTASLLQPTVLIDLHLKYQWFHLELMTTVINSVGK
jgi:hypothetical protein